GPIPSRDADRPPTGVEGLSVDQITRAAASGPPADPEAYREQPAERSAVRVGQRAAAPEHQEPAGPGRRAPEVPERRSRAEREAGTPAAREAGIPAAARRSPAECRSPAGRRTRARLPPRTAGRGRRPRPCGR